MINLIELGDQVTYWNANCHLVWVGNIRLSL